MMLSRRNRNENDGEHSKDKRLNEADKDLEHQKRDGNDIRKEKDHDREQNLSRKDVPE